ncbi:MAG TPA: DUF5916 domain-containing protein [Longimicrobium sp.]|nr:DUF5916 domain-containing protein [Longimicrobium sp.]
MNPTPTSRPLRASRAPLAFGAFLLALCAAAAPAGAQAAAPSAAVEPDRRRVTALRVDAELPRIDGKLDDAAWALAPAADSFVQRRPTEGAPAAERTEVRFLYGADALYVGARMYSRDPAAIQAPVGRRDNDDEQTETLLVSLDAYLDRRTATTFGITPAGTRLDWYHASDRESGASRTFDPVWEGEARVDSLGWTAEMRIPYTQLRFHRLPTQTWGVNVRRWVPNANEESYWVLVPRSRTGWASRFGDLGGIEGIEPTRRLEISPYVAGDARYNGDPGSGNPFDDGSRMGMRFGGDLKMGVGPSLTLEGTFNPDFGQVEADAADVNLTAFETIFPEKRPIFIEGSGLLLGNGPSYFYSRRVGARPRGSAPGDYVDYPEATTILGAAKLTGRLRSGTSMGVLAAVTGEERARVWVEDEDGIGSTEGVRVAPRTGFLVGRVQRDVGRGGSVAGLSFTAVGRDLPADDALSRLLTRQAYAGGADWVMRFGGGTYVFSGYAGMSLVQGDSAALIGLQRSSARYFQRPDAGHVDIDSTRTTLGGYTASLSLAKEGGKHWLWRSTLLMRSPGFEINDAGRLAETDLIYTSANLTYRENEPGKLLREYSAGMTGDLYYNFDGTRTFSTVRADLSAVLRNYWGSYLTGWVDFRAQSDRLTRGGPLMGVPMGWTVGYQLYNSGASRTRWLAGIEGAGNELGLWRYRVSGRFSMRPGPRWQLSVTPSYSRSADPRQYVTTLAGGRQETFGRRYVFATIDRSQVAAQIRMNYALTPDLTLETYVEPFAASGRYSSFGELEAARSRDLRVYGRAEGTTAEEGEDGALAVTDGGAAFSLASQNFDVRSFRSNAVLRWEWRPGSTLFLVWQQDRYGEEARGRLVGPRSLWETVEEGGDNRFAVKVTYWLPVR